MALADTLYSDRRRALAAKLAAERIDSILVTHMTHVRYLTGFTGSNAAVIINKDLSAVIATDGRYTTQVKQEVPDLPVCEARNCAVALLEKVEGPRRVAIEGDYVTVSEHATLVRTCAEDVTLVAVSGVIEDLRLIKSHQENDLLRSVAAIANEAFLQLIDAGELAIGRTERQVAADLEYRMRCLGSERTSFDTIVASGPNSAMPHHGADDRVLERGDLVTIDFGAYCKGYNSDMTRTVVLGEASAFAQEIYDVVHRSQCAGVEAALAGTPLVAVDKVCRDIIASAGYGQYFVHSTGHGVGLDVHELPNASLTGKGVLQPGMTLTIEPGVYIPGQGGVRIEDTLLITDGVPEIITTVPKDLLILS